MSQRLMRTPRQLDLELTSQCNLRCRYCYYFQNEAVVYRDLPTDEWLRFLDELGSLQVMEVTLSGGEALCRTDIRALISRVVANRMRFSLLSNGALIDDDTAAFLAATRRCNHVQVSIDGARPDQHDPVRGRGSFAAAVAGLWTLQRHRVPVSVRVTLHRFNVNDLPAVAAFLLDDLGLPAFSTNTAGFLGACRTNSDQLQLTIPERQLAAGMLARLNRQYGGRIHALAGPLAEARLWPAMLTAAAQAAPAFAHGGRLTGCGCTFDKLAVRADGTVIPCVMLPHLALGRINHDRLVDIWQTQPELQRLRERQTIPLDSFAFCQGCPYRPYCTGNCPGLAYALTGEINHPSPDACLRRFLAGGGRVEVDAPVGCQAEVS